MSQHYYQQWENDSEISASSLSAFWAAQLTRFDDSLLKISQNLSFYPEIPKMWYSYCLLFFIFTWVKLNKIRLDVRFAGIIFAYFVLLLFRVFRSIRAENYFSNTFYVSTVSPHPPVMQNISKNVCAIFKFNSAERKIHKFRFFCTFFLVCPPATENENGINFHADLRARARQNPKSHSSWTEQHTLSSFRILKMLNYCAQLWLLLTPCSTDSGCCCCLSCIYGDSVHSENGNNSFHSSLNFSLTRI